MLPRISCDYRPNVCQTDSVFFSHYKLKILLFINFISLISFGNISCFPGTCGLLSGGAVTALNGLTGNVNVVAGTGISVSTSSPNITITNTGGTVTSVSVVSANGLTGTVANPTTIPAITLSTIRNGVLYGDGTSILSAGLGSSGQVLTSNGASAPSFQTPILTTVNTISGNAVMVSGSIYLVDTSSPRNLTLPAPTLGTQIIIKDNSGNAVQGIISVIRNGSERIEGLAATYLIQTNWGSIHLIADGVNWFIL